MNVRRIPVVCACLMLLAAASGCQNSGNPVSPEPDVTAASSSTTGAVAGTAIGREGGLGAGVSLRGVITAIDAKRMVFAFDSGGETLRIRADQNTQIAVSGSRQRVRFARLAPGMRAGVRAVHDAGSLLARTIVVMR